VFSDWDKVSEMKKAIQIVCVVLVAVCGLVNAAPIQWRVEDGGNGQFYEVIEQTLFWADAQAYAEEQSGYLATITYQDEQDFIISNLPLPGDRYWLGGYQPDGSEEFDGGWTWVTGEQGTYTNWASGEPNGYAENLLHLWGSGSRPGPQFAPGTWNDLGKTEGPFIVEYVPEPATLSLLALGGLAVLRRRRK